MKLVATIPTQAERRTTVNDERAHAAGRRRRLREFDINQRIAWSAAPNFDGDYVETVEGVLCGDQDGDLVVRDLGRNWFRPFDRSVPHHRAAWRATAAGAGVGFVDLEPGDYEPGDASCCADPGPECGSCPAGGAS